ncbi:CBU_0592 family membrane protein [Amycolatopsis saalfeldensis]|uniref:CBU-0592-like domain-containing protein n=1 Tax=Amycolatopsis saalfeldensis TaxID=394193 RepID=A0A1H8YPB1_9PSEU|nr:hypothetical protein [Amycolatopsis saalfeldensis]SEP53996.1 hypothetical protein SAMN04489732_13451 [Amycolatopsis saalfeldensis]
MSIVSQIVQIGGSVLLLASFLLAQIGTLHQKSRFYLAMNSAGSAVLALDALAEHQIGFLLLEGVWSAASVVGLLRECARGADPAATAPSPNPSARHTPAKGPIS